MDTFLRLLPVFVTITIAAGGAIVWLVRLEGKIMKTNTIINLQNKACADRHATEKEYDTTSRNELRESINQIFNLIRTVQSSVDGISGEIKGWKNGLPKS